LHTRAPQSGLVLKNGRIKRASTKRGVFANPLRKSEKKRGKGACAWGSMINKGVVDMGGELWGCQYHLSL